jgi:hypothetical protein
MRVVLFIGEVGLILDIKSNNINVVIMTTSYYMV